MSIEEAYTQALYNLPRNAITIRPQQIGGVPCVRGTRLPVYSILQSLSEIAANLDVINQVMADFPDATVDDVRNALLFAADVCAHPDGE